MAKSKRAPAVVFGFDFQVNAAIILMLDNMDNLESLRLEGNFEDIEIKLNDGNYILAQAKSVKKSSTDFSHVRENLKKSLQTLSEGGAKVPTKKLILITNSPNPLNDEFSRFAFYGLSHRYYNDLPDTSKRIVDGFLKELSYPLDTEKFVIQVVPFETDEDDERYKVIKERINEFVANLNLSVEGIGKQLMTIWHNEIFQNASKENASIVLTKKDLIWPIIVIVTDINRCDSVLQEEIDESLYDEVVHKYRAIINSCCERYDFFIKVLYDYKNFQSTKKAKYKCHDFVVERWKDYIDEFEPLNVDDEIKKVLIQIILYSIVKNRIVIDNIKKGVNL